MKRRNLKYPMNQEESLSYLRQGESRAWKILTSRLMDSDMANEIKGDPFLFNYLLSRDIADKLEYKKKEKKQSLQR